MAFGQRQEHRSGRGKPGGDPASRPGLQEDTLKSEKLQIERKTFVFALKENQRGRFVRITEDVGGRRDTIIIPASGLREFQRAFDQMVQAAEAPAEQAHQ
ncbi:MAG: PUR family DNA/RNA-binding protein, partial [Gammaproteobacteria bacterium]